MRQLEGHVIVLVRKEEEVQENGGLSALLTKALVVAGRPEQVHSVRWVVGVVLEYSKTSRRVLLHEEGMDMLGKLIFHKKTLLATQVVKVVALRRDACTAGGAQILFKVLHQHSLLRSKTFVVCRQGVVPTGQKPCHLNPQRDQPSKVGAVPRLDDVVDVDLRLAHVL